MGVHVAGGDGVDAEVVGEIPQGGIAPRVTSLVGPLQLDEEVVAAERAGQAGGGVRIAHGEAVASAAGQADESFRMLLDEPRADGRGQRLMRTVSSRPSRRVPACASVRMRHRFV